MRTLSSDQKPNVLLPVGFKLHCVSAQPHLARAFKTEQHFNAHGVKYTYILPPYSSVELGLQTLESLTDIYGLPLLNNGEVLIQVCHPARLAPVRAAILAIVFFATSNYLRVVPIDLYTTHDAYTNIRPVIYDYDFGSCDRDFDWLVSLNPWRMTSFATVCGGGRTDILTVKSAHEIRVLNFVATLLVHHQHNGAWRHFGDRLILDVTKILNRHLLGNLLDIIWVTGTSSKRDTETFQFYFLEFLDSISKEATQQTFRPGLRSEISNIVRVLQKGVESCTSQFSPTLIPH
jgi:hypothetical protein